MVYTQYLETLDVGNVAVAASDGGHLDVESCATMWCVVGKSRLMTHTHTINPKIGQQFLGIVPNVTIYYALLWSYNNEMF
jgi:hypothetical protein